MAAAPLPSGQTQNPKARETARRRAAYERIDAAYFAGQISESARELAKWQLRVLCGLGTSFDTTQSEQARRFLCPCRRRYLSRRQILRLNEELDAADLIWREIRGNGYRTHITAYVPRPVACAEDREAPAAPAQQAHEPTYDEVRQALDRAMAAGEAERAAMLAYQLAMLLARQANVDQAAPVRPDPPPVAALFFGAAHGDTGDTSLVTRVSPPPRIKDSDIPDRDVESSVCGTPAEPGGDGNDTHSNGKKHGKDVPATPAVTRLRAWGVESPTKLRHFSAAPLEQIDHAFLAAQQAGGGVGLGLAMLEHGVWKRGSSLVSPPGVSNISGQQERHYARPCPSCGAHSVRLTLPGSCCEQCGRWPDAAVGTDNSLRPDPALWQQIMERIDPDQERLAAWLALATLAHDDAQRLVVVCPNRSVCQAIKDQYLDRIGVEATALLGCDIQIDIIAQDLLGETRLIAGRDANESCPTSSEARIMLTETRGTQVLAQVQAHGDQGIHTRAETVLKQEQHRQRTDHMSVCVAAYDDVWQMVTTQVNVPHDEWITWIAPTRLLHLDQDYAIIGTPNTFVRDVVEERYRQQLAAGLSARLGRPLQVQVVIASSMTRRR
jgi:hypothetical protein